MEFALLLKDLGCNHLLQIYRATYYMQTQNQGDRINKSIETAIKNLSSIIDVNTVENVLVTDLLYQSMPWTDVDNGNLDFN